MMTGARDGQGKRRSRSPTDCDACQGGAEFDLAIESMVVDPEIDRGDCGLPVLNRSNCWAGYALSTALEIHSLDHFQLVV